MGNQNKRGGGKNTKGKEDGEERRKKSRIAELTQKYVSAHRRAERHQGSKPTDDMMVVWKALNKYRTANSEEDTASAVDETLFSFSWRPYRPSALVTFIDSHWLRANLEPLTFADMRLDVHHRGQYIRLKNIGYSKKSGCMHCGVEDTNGKPGRLALYNIPHHRKVEFVLPHFGEFIVKEPYYTLHHDGRLIVRVDHPSDLIISSPLTTGMVSEGGLLQYPREPEDLFKHAKELMEKGEKAIEKKEWEKADAWLQDAARIASENRDPQMNRLYRKIQSRRCLVSLNLGKLAHAWHQATASLESGSVSSGEKKENLGRYDRAAESSSQMQDDAMARIYWEKELKYGDPENSRSKGKLFLLEMREQQRETGSYNMRGIRAMTRDDRTYNFDYASFLKKVEVVRNRCLRAKCTIRRSKLILAERAFEVIHEESRKETKGSFRSHNGDPENPRTIGGAEAALVPAVLEKCMGLLGKTRESTGLFDEVRIDSKLPAPYNVFHIEDVLHVHSITWITGISKSRKSSGIWPVSAHIRGSDNPNAACRIFGNMLFLFARRDIAKGETISIRFVETFGKSHEPERFPYRVGEDYQGGWLEPFIKARQDVPPTPKMEPDRWLFEYIVGEYPPTPPPASEVSDTPETPEKHDTSAERVDDGGLEGEKRQSAAVEGEAAKEKQEEGKIAENLTIEETSTKETPATKTRKKKKPAKKTLAKGIPAKKISAENMTPEVKTTEETKTEEAQAENTTLEETEAENTTLKKTQVEGTPVEHMAPEETPTEKIPLKETSAKTPPAEKPLAEAVIKEVNPADDTTLDETTIAGKIAMKIEEKAKRITILESLKVKAQEEQRQIEGVGGKIVDNQDNTQLVWKALVQHLLDRMQKHRKEIDQLLTVIDLFVEGKGQNKLTLDVIKRLNEAGEKEDMLAGVVRQLLDDNPDLQDEVDVVEE